MILCRKTIRKIKNVGNSIKKLQIFMCTNITWAMVIEKLNTMPANFENTNYNYNLTILFISWSFWTSLVSSHKYLDYKRHWYLQLFQFMSCLDLTVLTLAGGGSGFDNLLFLGVLGCQDFELSQTVRNLVPLSRNI